MTNSSVLSLDGLENYAEALQQLKEGNDRFVRGDPQHPHADAEWRTGLLAGQHPFAAILGCSDSRVPPELLFDQGMGDLFVVRVAGHAIDDDVAGSIGYAVRHLDTRLVVVLGHSDCGAITAALAPKADREREPVSIRNLLGRLDPAIRDIPSGLPDNERVRVAVEANVRWWVGHLQSETELQKSSAGTTITGAIYDLATGRVEYI